MNIKYFIIQKIPSPVFVFLRGRGWRGSYKSWEEASRKSVGYGASNILEKVKILTRELIEKGKSKDPHTQYPWELLSSLMWIAAQNKGYLNIIDFGGSLGTIYYENKYFFDQLGTTQWNVVEQSHYVELGKKEFENDNLKFFFSVDECISQNKVPVQCVLFGSVLQYLEKPYELLSGILEKKFRYIIITRTGFTINRPDRITIQKVPKSYYDTIYPCWIFEERKFLDLFNQHGYELVFDYMEKHQLNIPSEYKGMLFKLK